MVITASQLYDYVACPQRVSLDQYGDPARRDEISPFVRLLWERGTSHEAKVVGELSPASFVSLRDLAPASREEFTLKAMGERVPLIYGGRISADDLLGEPDLLVRTDAGYLPADIKSGRGEEGDSDEGDGKPKPHYAVQIALYADILGRLGLGVGRVGEIWDVHGEHVRYELDSPRHSRTDETWWAFYQTVLGAVRGVNDGTVVTRGALASTCKLCHWHSHCREELASAFDLSLIPSLGRSARDALSTHFVDLNQFAASDPESLIDGKKTAVAGVGAERLRLFHSRAKLLCEAADAKPYLRSAVDLPMTPAEVFFDIEADPMNDIVYLHGFVERHRDLPAETSYTAFFAEACDPEAERHAFEQSIGWLRERENAAVYYFSKYERTMYRKLCQRHPGVIDAEAVEALFTHPRSVDLYFDVVFRATEWPTYDHSIKTLAKYLGFQWRDTDPSGASSIEWYHRWLETGDLGLRQRIIDYNEDDCLATAVLLDGVRSLVLR
jgi:uncharacterized protein